MRAVRSEVVENLAACFRRNGYVRRQNAERLEEEGYQVYKKGDEVRLIAETLAELGRIRRWLKSAGFRLSMPFAKARQWCQPVYGRAAVRRFLELIGEPLDDGKPSAAQRKN